MGLYKRKSEWWIDFYLEGRRIRKPIGPVRAMAEEALAVVKADIAKGTFGLKRARRCPTFKEFADTYYNTYSAKKKSVERDRSILKHLCRFFGGSTLRAITEMDIVGYQVDRQKEVCKLSVNRELACLRHMLNVAVKDGHIDANPMKDVKPFRVENKKQRILTEDEITALLEATKVSDNPYLHSVVLVALNTGMRLREVLNLEWNDLNFHHNEITVRNTKSGSDRRVSISVNLREVLVELPSMGKSAYVFPNPKTDEPYKWLTRRSFSTALKRAGIGKMRFHDLRHTAATYMVRGGIDLVTVKELLGHSRIDVTMRYCQSNSALKAKAVDVMRKLTEPCPDGHLSAENGPKTNDVLTHPEAPTSLVSST